MAIDATSPSSEAMGAWPERSAWLRRYALALTRSPHEADDLTQETIARVLERSPDRIDHEGYLLQTASRLWIDQARRRQRRARVLRAIAGSLPAPRAARRDDRTPEIDRVERTIASLPPVQRAVIVLRAVMGLSPEQIAHALEIEPSAVRASLHLARSRVRDVMERTS